MKRDAMPLSTLLLAVVGMLALVPTASGHVALLGTAIALLVAWAIVERRTAARIPGPVARAADLLVATIIVALAVTHFAMESASLATLGHVLAVSQLARAFRRKRPVDLMVMNGTAVAQAGLASFLTRAPVFLPALLLTVVLGVLASLRVARMGSPEGKNVRIFTARPRGSAGLRARMGAIAQPVVLITWVLLIGVAFFVVLPRGRRFRDREEERRTVTPASSVEVRGGGASSSGRTGFTGFSDRISLGEVGRIKEVLREAFRVRITDGRRAVKATGPLYFRGAVFDTFDGRQWQRRAEPAGGERWLATETLPAEIPVREAGRRAATRMFRQRYRVKETFARALPALATVVTVRLDSGLPRVLLRAADTYAARDVPESGLEYEVTSLVSTAEGRPAVFEGLGEEERALHLALPPGTTRLIALAREVAGEGHPLDRSSRLARWLGENCDYTLSFRPWPSGRPVHDFLFETRAGHCEYFATALALMLRAVDVPSRMVAGYRGGLWIEDSEEYYLRLNDAHAWVEAHIPDRGWVRLDATPPDAGALRVPESRVPGLAEDIDFTDIGEEIVTLFTEFGPEDRDRAFGAATGAVEFVLREGFGLGRKPRPFPPPLTVLAGAALLTLLAGRLLRGVRAGRRSEAGPHAARRAAAPPRAPFYEAAVRVLAQKGLARRRTQSPREFLDSVLAARGEATRPFARITNVFEGVRYGRRPLPDALEQEMRRLTEELRERLSPEAGSEGPPV